MLSLYGEDKNLTELAKWFGFNGYKTRPGIYIGEIITYVNNHTNLSARKTTNITDADIILLKYLKHYVVLTTFENTSICVIDPISGYYCMPHKKIKKNQIVGIKIYNPKGGEKSWQRY